MKFYISIIFSFIYLNINAQVFRCIVAKDGTGTDSTLQAAIDKCPDNVRSIIYVKKGTYYGQTYLGTKTVPSSKIISIIGEDRDQVIITYDKSLTMVTKFEEATTFQIYAKDFYAEDVTFANSAGNTGQALALYTAGDRCIFKNCVIKGYQDTYRSKKGTRGYFKNCTIEGATDFIYAGGTIFFDDCEIRCVKGGGYIVAPEDAYAYIPKASTTCQKNLQLGFIFRNCNITANADVTAGSYYLGRPWNVNCGAFYLNCKLGKHINTKGWTTMGGNETTACFAEYNSMDESGIPVDITGRVTWSFQLPKSDVDNLLTLAGVYNRISTTLFDPEPICIKPQAPANLTKNGNTISWNKVSGAAGYLILKGGKYVTSTTDSVFTDITAQPGVFSVKTIGQNGQMSDATTAITGIGSPEFNKITIYQNKNELLFSDPVTFKLYNMNGILISTGNEFSMTANISKLKSGTYFIICKSQNKNITSEKLIITQK